MSALTDAGAVAIARMALVFTVAWAAGENEYVSTFALTVGDSDADLVLSAPMLSCELLRPAVLPLRITNVPRRRRVVRLCFGSGEIQPMMKSRDVAFGDGEEVAVVEFGFIPLAPGEHRLNVWAEEGAARIVPMLPLYLSVQKPAGA
jgi:hypothetical protein